MSDPLSNKHPNHPQRCAGQLTTARRRGAPAEEITAIEQRLALGRVQLAVNRLLAGAPPLSVEQVAYLRAVIEAHSVAAPDGVA